MAKTKIDQIAGECIAGRLRILNRVTTNIYDDALRPLDLKVSQMNVLVAASVLELAKPSEVCEILNLDVSTLSRNVDRMRARGWLEIVPDADGRAQPFRLTQKGRKLLEKAYPVWKDAQDAASKILGRQFVEQLVQITNHLFNADK